MQVRSTRKIRNESASSGSCLSKGSFGRASCSQQDRRRLLPPWFPVFLVHLPFFRFWCPLSNYGLSEGDAYPDSKGNVSCDIGFSREIGVIYESADGISYNVLQVEQVYIIQQTFSRGISLKPHLFVHWTGNFWQTPKCFWRKSNRRMEVNIEQNSKREKAI